MHTKTRAILLQAVKHHDSALLLKLFTYEKGLITCYVKNPRSKTRKNVKWQVLDRVQVELVGGTQKEIYGLKECVYEGLDGDRYFDPYKVSVSYFIAEVLLKVISESHTSTIELFDFAVESINNLNKTTSIALLPLEFLVKLAEFLGITPRVMEGGDVFNLSEGTIEKDARGLQSISIPEVPVLGTYIVTNNFETAPGKEQRVKMLQLMLDFYKYHVPGFIELKSLIVLKEVLN